MKPYNTGMYFYDIWVGSAKVHASEPLTYSCSEQLKVGEVVRVPVRQNFAMGYVVAEVTPLTNIVDRIKSIAGHSDIVVPHATIGLHDWLQTYYPAASGLINSLFLPPSLPLERTKEEKATPDKIAPLPSLTDDQKKALMVIKDSRARSILLHGATGTGKTRVYIELARQAVAQNKSVVILTPEIGLTPQMADNFSKVFPEQVIVMHSNLSSSRLRDNWYKIANAPKPLIVIGPRSALFAPLKEIGLVVVDEAHEPAYKQEQAPYYQATRVASQLARIHGALCIFGTATPSVGDYFVFSEKKLPIINLNQPATGKIIPPTITISDLKDPSQRNESSIVSRVLLESIKNHTQQGQQALLFLNRRGSARVVLCQNCGWQAICPNCDIPMTYHGDQYLLRCHTCGITEPIKTACPVCASSDILYQTPGTKSLEAEARRLFPELKVQRFDSDNVASEKLERHFDALVSGEIDIIIGTQLVTKGLDLPKLGVVGIINADTGLNFPDFTSEERTYQQLSQVIGRVGRHQLESSIVIQTYNPDNPLFKLVTSRDWQAFYKSQLQTRQQFGFPPYSYLLQLTIARATAVSARTAGQNLTQAILSRHKSVKIRGPSPRMHEKIRGKYHWQIVVSSKQRSQLLNIIEELPSGWQYNIDPANLM